MEETPARQSSAYRNGSKTRETLPLWKAEEYRQKQTNNNTRHTKTKTMKMNRITLTTIAAGTVAVMMLASCQRDELRGGALEGEERAVTVTALMPSDPVEVRSNDDPGDGTLANRCLMQVYVVDDPHTPIAYGEPQTAAVSNLSATFETRLMSGHAYRLVFWADCATAPAAEGGEYKDKYYSTEGFPTEVSLISTAFRGNQDELDAFFGETSVTTKQLAAGPVSVTADLTRPFGQLNIYSTDYADIPVEMKPAAVKIAFFDVYTSIDLTTGELSDPADLTYSAAVAPHDAAGHLTFDYLLATGEEDAIADFTMNFYTSADATAEAAEPYTFSSIPVRRNYITNVRGNLLTDRTEIEVDIVPGFDGEYNEIIPETEVSDAQTLLTVLEEGGYARLTGDVTITGASAVADGKEVVMDLDGHSLTLHGTMSTSGTSSLTLMNGTVKSSEPYGAVRFLVMASAGGSVALENVTMTSAGAGIGVAPSGDPGKVTVRNSSITAYSFAVGTNASTPIRNAEIELYNSELVGMSAVLMNIPSVITVSGCTLQGSMHAMILRAGTAEITDSHLMLVYDKSNGEGDTAEDAKDNYIDKWGSGNAVPLAAITVGNDNSEGYLYPTVLTIDNSVVTADKSGALPAMYVRANTDADKGVTITYGENCKVEGSIECYADGSNITVNGTPITE